MVIRLAVWEGVTHTLGGTESIGIQSVRILIGVSGI